MVWLGGGAGATAAVYDDRSGVGGGLLMAIRGEAKPSERGRDGGGDRS